MTEPSQTCNGESQGLDRYAVNFLNICLAFEQNFYLKIMSKTLTQLQYNTICFKTIPVSLMKIGMFAHYETFQTTFGSFLVLPKQLGSLSTMNPIREGHIYRHHITGALKFQSPTFFPAPSGMSFAYKRHTFCECARNTTC